jgi:hypothetical protein
MGPVAVAACTKARLSRNIQKTEEYIHQRLQKKRLTITASIQLPNTSDLAYLSHCHVHGVIELIKDGNVLVPRLGLRRHLLVKGLGRHGAVRRVHQSLHARPKTGLVVLVDVYQPL